MNTIWDTPDLQELADRIWGTLTEATQQGAHPWRTPVLCTRDDHRPSARTVVLRGLTRPGFELIAFSDSRALKIAHLTAHPGAAWLFYDPVQQVQVRAISDVRLHVRDPVAQTYWHRLPDEQRCRYQSRSAPGTPVDLPNSRTPGDAGDEHQFAVLIATVHELDWLWLGPVQHRRARFVREGPEWRGRWVEP